MFDHLTAPAVLEYVEGYETEVIPTFPDPANPNVKRFYIDRELADAALAESDKRIAELEGEVERLRAELKLANDCICERTAQRNEAEAALLARRAEEGGSDG